ncbi:MAG: PAS domain-containing protein [Gemmatimonadetes bacterium]|nr:PAS domain-containing protein [Gemmatimonadota bacterium]
MPQPASGDRLASLIARLADAPDDTSGLTTLLAGIGKALRASWVELRPVYGDAIHRWGAPADHEPAIISEHRCEAAGAWIATLVIGGGPEGDARSADDVAMVNGAARLLAVLCTRDAHRQALEAALTARVREVAAQRAFMETVIDSLPIGLYVVDRAYRIQAWNHKRETGAQGVSRGEALGRPIFDVLSRQPADRIRAEFDEVFATGRLQQFQMESDAFGEPRTFRISKIPMRVGGDEVTHVITLGEDITDVRAAFDRSARTEKLAALGQLAAGVMHELNNPLATIAACAESMAPPGGEVVPSRELLGIIDLEVQRCKKIVNGLLDFARPQSAGRALLDLSDVVRRAAFLLEHHPRRRRIRLETALAEAPLLVYGDMDQLVQVVIALAMNAIDATPEGKRVLLRTQEAANGGVGRAHLEVADEGPGVPRALQAKVFEPFFTTKPPGQGTGLGLAICYGIVNEHGGALELSSPDGEGATFRVALPTAAPGAAQAESA